MTASTPRDVTGVTGPLVQILIEHQMTNSQKYRSQQSRFGPQGGPGGGPFDEMAPANSEIGALVLTYGGVVETIQVLWRLEQSQPAA